MTGRVTKGCGSTACVRPQPHRGGPHPRAVEGDQLSHEAEAALPLL